MRTKTVVLVLWLAAGAAYAATEEHVTRTFPAVSGGTVVVDVDFGAIEVDTNASAADISVDAWRKITRKTQDEEQRYLKDHPIEFSAEGATLKIRCRGKEKNLFASGKKNRNEAKYVVRVPAKFNTRLDTAGGEITVSNLTGETRANTSGGRLQFHELHGPLSGHTSGGDVHLADCDGTTTLRTSGGNIEVAACGGSLDAKTSGGSIKLQGFNGPAGVDTSGGPIQLANISGKLKASTSGGSIRLVMISPVPGEVTLSTSGGDMTLEAPDNAAFNIDAHTSGGHVTCELPVSVKGKIEKGQLKGEVNGGGPDVVLRTGGGGIRVEKLSGLAAEDK